VDFEKPVELVDDYVGDGYFKNKIINLKKNKKSNTTNKHWKTCVHAKRTEKPCHSFKGEL